MVLSQCYRSLITTCILLNSQLICAEPTPSIDPLTIKYVLSSSKDDRSFSIKAHHCSDIAYQTVGEIKKEPLIGTIICKIDKKDSWHAYIIGFNVDTSYQGYGVDLTLVTKALNEFEQKNCIYVDIDIPCTDETMIFFFKLLGFKELGFDELEKEGMLAPSNVATMRKVLTPFQNLRKTHEISATVPSQTVCNAAAVISMPINGVPAPKFKHG